MSKYYVDSFAYDFSMFMPQEEKKDNIVEINRKANGENHNSVKKRKKRRNVLAAGTVVRIAFIAIILGMIVGNIYLRVQVTEVTSKINAAQIKYDRLTSENISLEMELESSVSYKNLEESAKQLGMQKAEPYQINYINSVSGDKTEVKSGDQLTATADEK